jgi:branched-chain amino acid transport system substrate-binding protein
MGISRMTRVWSLIALLALVLAACGEADITDEEIAATPDDTVDEPETDDEPVEDDAVEETPTPDDDTVEATGEPIVIGMINQEGTPAGSFPENREAAEAAVEYVNQELGGVDGRPFELIVEITDATPESASAAANALLEQDPVVVTPGVDFGTAASIPIFEEANMPYVGGVPLLPPELTSAISFTFTGGSVAAFPGQSVYIGEELGAETVNIIYTDNPAGLEAATTFGQSILEQVGVQEVNLIPEDANATDFTPAVSAANEGDPDAIMVLFAAQGCSRIMQAVASLGIETAMFYPGSCLDDEVIQAGGEGAEGAYFNSEHILYNDTDDPDVALYREAMEQYRPDAKISGFSQSSFTTIINLHTIMTEIGADNVTSEAIIDYLEGTQDHESFMTHTFTCAEEQVAGLISVCNAAVRIVQLQDGEPVDLLGEWVDGTEYLRGEE